jgi:NADH-quinone oxidoreductase subunit C
MATALEPALVGNEAVFEVHGSNPAITALRSELPDALVDSRFDRGELTLTIARDHIREAAAIVQKSGYNFLEDVTCVDWLPAKERFQVTYHILSHSLKQRIRLIALVEEADPVIASITSVWPSANFYEREVFDLFGVRFGGHPNMRRIMMPDEWEGHPLRKDYPVEGYR